MATDFLDVVVTIDSSVSSNDDLEGNEGDDLLIGAADEGELNGGIGTDQCLTGETVSNCP